jgi:hypothetical protein
VRPPPPRTTFDEVGQGNLLAPRVVYDDVVEPHPDVQLARIDALLLGELQNVRGLVIVDPGIEAEQFAPQRPAAVV